MTNSWFGVALSRWNEIYIKGYQKPIRPTNPNFGVRELRKNQPQNTRITVDFGLVTDSKAVPLWTKFKRVGVSVATRSSRP
ncbi:hypothetical protein L614_000900000380 [Ochrobactrum sp. J50]|nr:hypothetical protein L614_000900000380 [Ochrobactrum sp. J50]